MNIINSLDKYLLDESSRARTSHHPSDITACLRQLYYKWTGQEKSNPPTAGNIIKMRFGNLAEKIIEDWLEYEKQAWRIKDFQTQVEITADLGLEYKIHGYQDFLIELESGEQVGIECKSSFGRGIVEIQKTGNPKPEHLAQVYLYLKYGTAKRYHLLYLGRDNGYRTVFQITLAGDNNTLNVSGRIVKIDFENMIARLGTVENAVRTGGVPDREYRAIIKHNCVQDKVQFKNEIYKTDWQCQYCDYRDFCWQEFINQPGIIWGGETIG